jgi:hypothetical protein
MGKILVLVVSLLHKKVPIPLNLPHYPHASVEVKKNPCDLAEPAFISVIRGVYRGVRLDILILTKNSFDTF